MGKCPRRDADEETLIHALKDCPSTRDILTHGGLDNGLINGNYMRCIDWLEDAFQVMDLKAAADFLTLLWNCWNSRNNCVFKDNKDDARVWERAMNLSEDFRIHSLVNTLVILATPICKAWSKPLTGAIKINFDATVSNGKMGY